jgi:aspartyl-tRNA(Asn)/glutamyl-tRNA(Gln) amidotransferase subunit C
MKREDILSLAELARIELTDAEIEQFSKEFDDILSYVGEIKGLAKGTTTSPKTGVLTNVFRDDVNPNEPGAYTETLLDLAPARQGRYLSVKKVLKSQNG